MTKQKKLLIFGFVLIALLIIITSSQSIELEPQYKFIQGKFSPSGDMHTRLSDIENNIPKLKEWCNNQDDCIGFSTNGWMKKSIKNDRNLISWNVDNPKAGTYRKI